MCYINQPSDNVCFIVSCCFPVLFLCATFTNYVCHSLPFPKDGYLLMGLENESQLAEDPFLISNALHRKAIYSALERIKDIGGKPPRDVWEYRVSIEWNT